MSEPARHTPGGAGDGALSEDTGQAAGRPERFRASAGPHERVEGSSGPPERSTRSTDPSERSTRSADPSERITRSADPPERTTRSPGPRERITRSAGTRERITGPAGPLAASARLAAVAGPAALRHAIIDALHGEGLEVTVADDPDGLDELTRERLPSLVVLTADAPLSSRSGAFAYARRRAREAQIVLVCSAIHGWEVRDALAAGVTGIVLRAELSDAFVPCLRAVRAGQVCVPNRNRNQLERPVLSAREKQILGLVVMGYTNRQIADRLFLAESTVKSHLSSAFGKLEVHSRNEAVDLILDPQRGLDLGILALGGEPLRRRADPGT